NILFGKVNPSGKLPETFPLKLEDNPSYGNFPGTGSRVKYEEGIYVGYRHYEANHIDPLFPFGHGLSYTHFEYGDLKIQKCGKSVKVAFSIKNIGQRTGKEVVQLYVRKKTEGSHNGLIGLREFDKVELYTGQTKHISFKLDESTFSSFSESDNK